MHVGVCPLAQRDIQMRASKGAVEHGGAPKSKDDRVSDMQVQKRPEVAEGPQAAPAGRGVRLAREASQASSGVRSAEVPGVVTGTQLAAGAKFDRAAYQREYMRKKRAEDRAKKAKP
jgi:hypothetical protein